MNLWNEWNLQRNSSYVTNRLNKLHEVEQQKIFFWIQNFKNKQGFVDDLSIWTSTLSSVVVRIDHGNDSILD